MFETSKGSNHPFKKKVLMRACIVELVLIADFFGSHFPFNGCPVI
jgi:hypothetical protein